MIDLFTPHAQDGAPLIRRADGRLCTRAAADGAPILAAAGPEDFLLLESQGLPIRIGDAGAAESAILVLRRESAGAEQYRLKLAATERYLGLAADLLTADASRENAALWRLAGWHGAAPGSALVRLPDDFAAREGGLAALFASGRPELRPVAASLFPAMGLACVREVWAAVHAPEKSVFHDMVRDYGREGTPPFSSYTVETMKDQIRQFGWSVGEKTYGSPLVIEAGRGMLTIGRYCSMANPSIILGNHNMRTATSYPFLDLWREWPGTMVNLHGHVSRDVAIGNDVWIGHQAVILPGAVIGDGAVIGAGCMVSGTVPPYAIYAGNPGQVRRYRFDAETIARLLRIRWWDWPDATVDRYIPLLLSTDIAPFLDAAEREFGVDGARGLKA